MSTLSCTSSSWENQQGDQRCDGEPSWRHSAHAHIDPQLRDEGRNIMTIYWDPLSPAAIGLLQTLTDKRVYHWKNTVVNERRIESFVTDCSWRYGGRAPPRAHEVRGNWTNVMRRPCIACFGPPTRQTDDTLHVQCSFVKPEQRAAPLASSFHCAARSSSPSSSSSSSRAFSCNPSPAPLRYTVQKGH